MVAYVLRFELARPVAQFPAPRGELVYRRVADPADLDGHAIGAEHAAPAELLELLGEEAVGQRAHAQLVAEQRVAVQRAPLVVCSVRALRPVGDRVVDVQLHHAVARVVLLEARHDEPGRVAPLARGRRMMPGADVRELPLRHGDHAVIGPLHRSPHLRGHLRELLRVRSAAVRLRFARSGQERRPEHRHRLGRRERVVVERDDRPELAAQLEAECPLLLRRHELAAYGLRRLDLGLDPLVQRPARGRVVRLPLPPSQDLAVRPDVLVVQPPHHGRVDLPGQTKRPGADALPVARRLPGRAGVVVGARSHGIRQVTGVVPGVQAQHG